MALSHGDYIASLPLSSVDLRFHHLQQLLVPVLEILSKILNKSRWILEVFEWGTRFKRGKDSIYLHSLTKIYYEVGKKDVQSVHVSP